MKKLCLLFLVLKTFLVIANPQNTVNELFDIISKGAKHDYIGEEVTKLEHALQCAQLALENKLDDEVVLAGLFHDIGQLCAGTDSEQMDGGFGVAKHEIIGAEFLKSKGFSDRVCQLVKSHVDAKRYLVFKRGDAYYNTISEASKETLKRQGGMMSAQEAASFENSPYFQEKITLRQFDEKAKIKGLKTRDLGFYRDICLKHLITNYQ